MATSLDGVHWEELGRVLWKRDDVTWMGTGSTWSSPNFRLDRRFQMNFSEWKGPRQTIFFAESPDLIHWVRLGDEYEFKQDTRWYELDDRWDYIYIIGVGAISGSHIQTISILPGGEDIEVHVSDTNPDALKRVREQHPDIQTHSDTAEMLAIPARAEDSHSPAGDHFSEQA